MTKATSKKTTAKKSTANQEAIELLFNYDDKKPSTMSPANLTTTAKQRKAAKPAPTVVSYKVHAKKGKKALYGDFNSITAHKAAYTLAACLVAGVCKLAAKGRIDSAQGDDDTLHTLLGDSAYGYWTNNKGWIKSGKMTVNGLNELKDRLEGKHVNGYQYSIESAKAIKAAFVNGKPVTIESNGEKRVYTFAQTITVEG